MSYPEYHNECRGCCLLKKCAIKNVQPQYTQYTKEFNIPFCPCMNCLVKVVCSETCGEKKSYNFYLFNSISNYSPAKIQRLYHLINSKDKVS